MTLGHLGQFNEINCDLRTSKVLLIYMLMLGFFFVVHCGWTLWMELSSTRVQF